MIIVGAGLAGLIAAHAWPQASLVEASPGPRASHAALLRFRSDVVAKLTGIDFHQVRVYKGIWLGDRFTEPNIRVANMYSSKVLAEGQLADRSIWNIDTVDRWVAPETLYEQLMEAVRGRVEWGVPFDWSKTREYGRVISTAPMAVPVYALLPDHSDLAFERAPIFVERFRVQRANVYQTVYFPTHDHSVYRASITKDLLIVEHAGEEPHGAWSRDVERAFALHDAQPLGTVTQRFGKIAPIEETRRRRILVELTQHHGVYSLGRFATWRNILLDDVVNDIAVIKRLIRIDEPFGYALRLGAS